MVRIVAQPKTARNPKTGKQPGVPNAYSQRIQVINYRYELDRQLGSVVAYITELKRYRGFDPGQGASEHGRNQTLGINRLWMDGLAGRLMS